VVVPTLLGAASVPGWIANQQASHSWTFDADDRRFGDRACWSAGLMGGEGDKAIREPQEENDGIIELFLFDGVRAWRMLLAAFRLAGYGGTVGSA